MLIQFDARLNEKFWVLQNILSSIQSNNITLIFTALISYNVETLDLNNKRSFLHINNNFFDFLSLCEIYDDVNRKYFSQIWKDFFLVENITKLINNYIAREIMNEIKNNTSKFKNIAYLKQCMKTYFMIVMQLTRFNFKEKLIKTFSLYKIYIFFLFVIYIFDSIILFHRIFVYKYICESQNDSF